MMSYKDAAKAAAAHTAVAARKLAPQMAELLAEVMSFITTHPLSLCGDGASLSLSLSLSLS